MRLLVTGPIAALLLASTPACTVYDEGLLTSAALRGYPSAPEGAIDGPDTEELVFALKDVRLDQSAEDTWRTIGWNLDRRTTTPEDPDMECDSPGGTPTIDGEAGIDNKFGSDLYPILQLRYANTQARFPGDSLERFARDSEEAGMGALVVRVRGYNGLPTDPHVRVDISQSVFGTQGSPSDSSAPAVDEAAGTLANGDPLPPLKWDGNDWFWVRTDNYVGTDLESPIIEDRYAYVVDNQVVIRLPDRATIRFVGPGLGVSVQLTDAVAVGTLNADRTAMIVEVGGRWAIQDLIQTAEYVGICPDAMDFELLTGLLAGFADVMSNPQQAGRGVVCDALSIGVTFEGPRARVGGLAPAAPLPNPCRP